MDLFKKIKSDWDESGNAFKARSIGIFVGSLSIWPMALFHYLVLPWPANPIQIGVYIFAMILCHIIMREAMDDWYELQEKKDADTPSDPPVSGATGSAGPG